jgi:DNA invertase Pin-like site-specific DNA recombinase
MSELKVTNAHLERDAYLYIRQSTPRQALENTESTQRQYALRERAVALGWPIEHIHVIDCDLGKTASQAAGRDGFQQLVSEVALGKAGIIMGLEVSRLARNCADWHRLMELCENAGTLILDADGLYDPAAFNDKLLLGLKGEMSQAELHFLKARMRGGMLNKARRGELEMPPPIGLVYLPDGRMGIDPDREIQSALRLVFDTFERTGSALQTVRYFREEHLRFPRRIRGGERKGELLWGQAEHTRIARILHNPRYAGAFVYGRTRTRRRPDGKSVSLQVPPRGMAVFDPRRASGLHQLGSVRSESEAAGRKYSGVQQYAHLGPAAGGTRFIARTRPVRYLRRTHEGSLRERKRRNENHLRLSGSPHPPRLESVPECARATLWIER